MRLLRKQLCHSLPSLFLPWLALDFVCCLSVFLIHFAPKVHDETKQLQRKLQQCKLVPLSLTQAGRWCRLHLAKKRSVEQPIGAGALWNDLWLAGKCPSWSSFFKAWVQSHGEEQKPSVRSDQLNHKNKVPTSSWIETKNKSKWQLYSLHLTVHGPLFQAIISRSVSLHLQL